jgi:GNAT superfamily N-acetyltransferase
VIKITRPTLPDLPSLTRLAIQSFWESHGHSAAAEDIAGYVGNKLTEEVFRQELLDEDNIFQLLHYNGQPAGYSKIILHSANGYIAPKNVTKLERLYFLKEFHGLGLAQQLFEHNRLMALQAGQTGIWLNTWTGNHRAVAFYQKLGFAIVGHTDFKISERHSNPNYVMYLEW